VSTTPPSGSPEDAPPPPPSPGPWASDSAPAPNVPVAPVAEQPPPIRTAVRLMYVGAALSVIGILLALGTRSEMRDRIAEDRPELTQSELDTALNVGTAFVVVGGLIGVGLWLWMASANGQGKSWARIVASVLGGLNVLFTLLGLPNQTAVSLVFSLIGLVLAAAILFLLWRPESSRFYEARSG
jgi:hypothetical protein